jgi:hypothetical protein
MVGAWYTWKSGGLTIIPEIQVQCTQSLIKYAGVVSGGVSAVFQKELEIPVPHCSPRLNS